MRASEQVEEVFIQWKAGRVSPTAGRRRWQDRGVGACSSSTVSPHGLLPPSSFYSLLLGDASLSPKVTQAKTPLSSFARAGYQGNSAVPPLLFCTHLLSSFFLHQSLPLLPLHLLPSGLTGHRYCFRSTGLMVICGSVDYILNSTLGFRI